MGFPGVNKTIPCGCGNKLFILNTKGTQEMQFIDGCKPLTWPNQPSPQGLALTTQIFIRIYLNISLVMALFLLIWGQLDWGIFPPVAELPTNPQVPLVKGIFNCVAVLYHQSGAKQQEKIILLAHIICGRWVQRVWTPLKPHSLLGTAEMTWHRLRFIQDTGKCVDLHKIF